jgi:hypothetical protein
MMVDLIPFGGLEVNGHIEWPQSKSEMNVIGFSDAYDHCMEVTLGDKLCLKVAPPPVLVALKLLAFADRKDRTDRDVQDLWHFISNYRYRQEFTPFHFDLVVNDEAHRSIYGDSREVVQFFQATRCVATRCRSRFFCPTQRRTGNFRCGVFW